MAAAGIRWTFGPVVAVARDIRWGRTYESYGEDPELVASMAEPAVRGFQAPLLSSKPRVMACAKHFIGDGGTTGGQNGGNTQVDEAALRKIHLPGYLAAIRQNAGSIMVSQSQWNGVACHGNRYLLTTVLKGELGFKGLLITDYDSYLLAGDYINDYPGCVSNAVNSGIDMAMIGGYIGSYPEFIGALRTLVDQGKVPAARVDDAVSRILTQKFRFGLFEHPYADRSLLDRVGSAEHRLVARECVSQSLVVLAKKDGILPVPKTARRIHVAGRHADDMGYQCGGWTITWQGASGATTPGTTILDGFRQAAPGVEVTTSRDGAGAEGADLGIAVIGETPYAEAAGDRNPVLDPEDVQTVRNLKGAGIPVIVVLVSGRPMVLNPILCLSDAVVAAWLPGTEGRGVADVLFGNRAPTGRLSQTWPEDLSQIPLHPEDQNYNPLFPFGHGITSLGDLPAGSPVGWYSAITAPSGSEIEITFTKRMADPPEAPAGFSVAVNGRFPVSVTRLNVKSDDPNTMLLTLADSVRKGNAYTVSYSPGTVRSRDGGRLDAFANLPVYNQMGYYKTVQDLPGTIEAEAFVAKNGMSLKTCSDTSGGKALVRINDNQWSDYYVNVNQSGRYLLEYRISSVSDTGQIELLAGGVSASMLTLPVTGSWDKWETVSTDVRLSEGPQLIRMNALQGGFQLNWMRFSFQTGICRLPQGSARGFSLSQNYPNPFNPETVISYSIPRRTHVMLKVLDLTGRETATLVDADQEGGGYTIRYRVGRLSSGMYFLILQAGGLVEVKRLVLLK
jgi:beta-glucosidase